MEGGPNKEIGAVENLEKPIFHFVYVDNSKLERPVVFECDADNITVADELYEEKIGEKPERQNHIGCSLVRN